MADFVSGFASSVTRDLVCGAVKELRYPCCFNNLVEDLQNENDKFVETRNSVQERIDDAKKQTKKTAGLVQKWLKEANNDIDKADELLKEAKTNKSCCFGCCPDWIWRYQLGRQLSERKRKIKICNTEGGNYVQIERRSSLPGLGYFPSEKCLKFNSRRHAYDELEKALKNDNVNMIGLYGMGGCGKTTLAFDIGNKSKKEDLFDEVIFVVVSSTVEVQKIQEDIATWLECELKEKTEMQRAQRLHKRVMQEEKILVILDNVWEPLDFVAIGIPSWKNHKGCKVLITTRSKDVCIGMDCQRRISLPLLDNEEAWRLFQIQAQISEATSDNLKHLARLISNECEGLPVLITAVASTLKGKAEVEWEVALDRLTSSKPVNIERGLQNPYKCLQLSYDNLDFKEAKSLFLLCSVFPEEYEIPVEDLTRFAKGLGLVGEIHSYGRARNEVCAAKMKLISSCLLLDAGDGRCVKMHDLIHKVALIIAEEEGKGIKCALDKEVTTEYSLLRYLWCEKLPYQLDCSNLEFLCINTYLEVSDEIFKEMKRLRVLFLVNKGLERRPLLINSFQLLKGLCCLLLENWKLGDTSFLVDPKKLESVTLRNCSFLELPFNLIKQLPSLKLLDFSECEMETNPFEVIGGHQQLEELYIDDRRSKWDLYNESTYELFNTFRVPQELQRYHIHLGTLFVGYQERLINSGRTLSLSCFDTTNAAIKDLAKKTEVLLIANIQGGGAKNIIPDIFEIDGGGMNELIELMISTSEDIEHLVDIGNHFSRAGTLFSKLRKLRIEGMKHLRSLYHGHPPSGLFEKLEELYIKQCPQLHGTLFFWKLNLSCLKDLELYECSKLISLFTYAVALSLVHLERLEILYCDGLKHILADDNKDEISENDDKLVFSKLKELTVRGCEKLEYIIPATSAHGLLQLKCLKIEFIHKLVYVFGQSKHGNQSHNELKINLPALEELTLFNLPNMISMCPKNCHPALPSLRQFTSRNCPEVAIMSINAYLVVLKGKKYDRSTTEIKKEWSLQEVRAIEKRELVGGFLLAGPSFYEEQDPLRLCLQKLSYTCSGLVQSMNLQYIEQIEVSGDQELLPLKDEDHQIFLNLHLESNPSEDFTSIPSTSRVNYNPGSFNLYNIKRLILRSCSMLRTLFSPSTAMHLTSLEELMIAECHELIYLVSYGKSHENKDGIIQEDHDSQSYDAIFPRLKSISVVNCNLLVYLFHVSYVQGLVNLKDIEIRQTHSLIYVFGHGLIYHNKIQTELPVLEKVALFSIPNMINFFPENYNINCPSLLRIVMEDVGLSTLSVNNLMVSSASTTDIVEASIKNMQVLESVAVWNSSKIKGIFHQDQPPMNGRQATLWLIDLNLVNLPELTYIWKGAKHSVTLQNLKLLYIWGCKKLKAIFSSAVARSLPQLKILVALQCDGLEKIIEDDEEHENAIYFSKLKLILVTQCNNLKRLFYLSAPHEFPELEYLIINQDPNLEKVFECQKGAKEDDVEVSLPQLKHVILMQLPNLNNFSQGIEFKTLTNLFVHNCPKLSLTSTTTVEDMLQSYNHDREIDFLVRCDLLYIRDIINKERAEKDQIDDYEYKQGVEGAVPSYDSELRGKSTTSLATSEHKIPSQLVVQQSAGKTSFLDQSRELGETIVNVEVSQISTIPTHDNIDGITMESIEESSTLKEVAKAALSANSEPRGKSTTFLEMTEHKIPSQLVIQQSAGETCFLDQSHELGETMVTAEVSQISIIPTHDNIDGITMESVEESSTLKEVAKAALSANPEPRGKSTTFLETTEHKIPSQLVVQQSAGETSFLDQSCELGETIVTAEVSQISIIPTHDNIDGITMESVEESSTLEEVVKAALSANSEPRGKSTSFLETTEHKIPSQLAGQQSAGETSFLDQHCELGETIITAEVSQISIIPTHDNIDGITKESVEESSVLEEVTEAALSANTEDNGFSVVILTHSKPSYGDMLAQHSHVDDSIQVGSNLMDEESGTSVVTVDSIEIPPDYADTRGSNSLTVAELRAYKDFDDMDDAQVSLLAEAITMYPHLWKVCEKFSKRFQGWMLKTLADMLLFLRNESPVSVTPQQEKKFHRLCDEAIQLGFDRSWVDRMRQRVIVKVPEVERALARLGELLKRHDQLTRELHEIKSEVNNLNDFVAAKEKCFDFL